MTIPVVHVIECFDLQAGSPACLLHNLLAALPDCGIAPSVLTLCGGRFGRPEAPDRVQLTAIETGATPTDTSRLRTQLDKLIASARIVHLHGGFSPLIRMAASAARRSHVPYVLSPNGALAPNPFEKAALRRRLAFWLRDKRILRRAACVLAASRLEADLLADLIPTLPVKVIPPGIKPQPEERRARPDALQRILPRLADRQCLLFLGRIHPIEGLGVLLRACEPLVDETRDWHLVLAGPAPERWRLQMEAAIRRRGEGARVTVLPDPDAHRQGLLLGAADLLVQPSLCLQLPVASLQAMAAGIPVIVSEQCGLPQIQEKQAGLVVAPNRRSLGDALQELLAASQERRQAMGRNARALVAEEFDCRVQARRYAELYASLESKPR
jgi:glycosyltransferase involved in cell wall biosynthesis